MTSITELSAPGVREQSLRAGPSSPTYTLVVPFVAGLLIAAILVPYLMDGPVNSIVPGGPLQEGELVEAQQVDWSSSLGGDCADGHCVLSEPVELQLLSPARSRYTGAMVHAGELYVPCDLGYLWSRFEGRQRWLMQTSYWFKTWHEHAIADGRAIVRIDGKRYAREAVKVTDQATVTALKAQLEAAAATRVAPDTLGAPPTATPNDIWFFRLAPR